MIAVFGTHVQNDDISSNFKIKIFQVFSRKEAVG